MAVVVAMPLHASLTVTRQTCNRQSGAMAVVAGEAMVGWQLGSDTNGDKQTAARIVVRESVSGQTVYDSGRQPGDVSQGVLLPSLPYNNGGYEWQVMVWDAAGGPSPWSAGQRLRVVPPALDAQWIGAISRAEARLPSGRWSNGDFKKAEFVEAWADVDSLSSRSIVVRKEFGTTGSSIVDAVVYVSGLGHYELSINGSVVGEDIVFAPLWSEYDRTVYYNTYDVTDYITTGGNAVSVLLGNGFFNVQRGKRYSKLQTSYGAPQLMLRLDITYADGTTQTIVSDDTWKYAASPVTFNSIYGGESYDARLERRASLMAGFDDSAWSSVVMVEGPAGELTAQTAPPVRIMERYGIDTWIYIPADSLEAASKRTKRTVSAGAFVCDMGQNLSGFPELTVRGRPGQTITVIPGENLTAQGACEQRQTGRQHYYEYTIGSYGEETWHPRFSYYGYRYLQIEGAVMEGEPNPDGLPVISKLSSCFVYNSADEVSSFECSNPLFTQTHRLIERAERSNMQGVLTDCPHREKLGWLEQDHLCGPSLLYNYDMTAYVPKVIRDITDTQKADGMVPTIAPQYVSFGNLFDDSPEWGSTLIVLPFMYYSYYGDSTLITRNYDAMRRYADYLTERADSGIVSHGLGDWYDYGPWRAGFSRNTPVPLVATAHYIMDLRYVAEAAHMTGRTADEAKYRAMEAQVIDAFNRTFYKPDSCYYGTGSQTSNALPLFLGLCGDNAGEVLQSLTADIVAHGNRLTTGDVGNRYLFRALADNGLNDLLYLMLNHYETPGYGFQLTCGATTLTEQWDPRNGSSWNHFMMGQIDEWLFRTLAGIRQQEGTVGMRHLVIEPTLVGDLEWVSATTQTLYGTVAVRCDRHRLTAEVPVGCDATIVTPAGEHYFVGSGSHTFTY